MLVKLSSSAPQAFIEPDDGLDKFAEVLLVLAGVVEFLGLVLGQLRVFLSHDVEARFTNLQHYPLYTVTHKLSSVQFSSVQTIIMSIIHQFAADSPPAVVYARCE